MSDFDPNKLPRRALIDTSVFIRFMGEQASDARAADCAGFVDAMVKARRTVLLASPSWAEFLRKKTVTAPPDVASIRIVGFDRLAAEKLADLFDVDFIRQVQDPHKMPKGLIKFDSLIAATAIRYRAEAIVSIDDDFDVFSKHIASRRPWQYKNPAAIAAAAQGSLFDLIPKGDRQK